MRGNLNDSITSLLPSISFLVWGQMNALHQNVANCQITLTVLTLRWKEGNVLFNDALNTFYLRLFGVRHMVKDHSDSEKGNPLQPHRLLFPINSKGSFISTEMEDLSSRYMNGSDRHERCGHGTVSESRKYNYW